MIYITIGLMGGFFSSLLGIGAGTIFVPAMVIFLGTAQLEAQASSLLFNFIATVLGYSIYHKYGHSSISTSCSIIPFAIIGIFCGIWVATITPVYWLRKVFAIVLIIAAYKNFVTQPSMSENNKIR